MRIGRVASGGPAGRFSSGFLPRRWTGLAIVALLAVLAATVTAVQGRAQRERAPGCQRQKLDPGYALSVRRALESSQDKFGNQLLSNPGGPTYQAAAPLLHPLMRVGKPAGLKPLRLTDSGVYYLPFGQPAGPAGATSINLHVADGSQIVSQVVTGPKLSVGVGSSGRERYGSCLARLATPGLWGGYLPVLETSYTDADGVHYHQESFAVHVRQTRSLVSFVKLRIDPRGSKVKRVFVRFTPSGPRLRRGGYRLLHGHKPRLLFSPGGRYVGSSVVYSTRGTKPRTVYVAWLNQPSPTGFLRLGKGSYQAAKRKLVRYWQGRLATGASLVVPEKRVYDAERNLLVQNMLMSARYSLGNSYERFSWELIDVAEVMGDYGFGGIEHAILEASLHSLSPFPNRAAGERMVGSAHYYEHYKNRYYIDRVTPLFQKYLDSFARQLTASGRNILGRERFGADISQRVYGVHAQALALQGLRAMAPVWAATGHGAEAATASALATNFSEGLLIAVSQSATTLPDGTYFVPIALLDGTEPPYGMLPSTKRGAYWNLVMPFALASGLFQPGGSQALGLLHYMLNHGSRFMGLVRFAPHTGVQNPGFQTPGTDDVYGINMVRALANNGFWDQVTLSLYGKLAAGMTQGTFVAGEGSSVGTDRHSYYRSMFRPPNSASNAFFLESLRLTLVHETPQGLDLGYGTPRAWLAPGKRVAVRGLRTDFGRLSYSLDAGPTSVRAHLVLPPRAATAAVHLRLRLPPGERITGVTLEGRAFTRFDAATQTIDLSGLSGPVDLVADRGN